LILGGVKIDFEKGLEGYSDADVLVHAIMDALLGAAALKDIGHQFPSDDPAHENASSIYMLEHVGRLVASEGYVIKNVDSVLIAQEPKIAPYIDDMRRNIARALRIEDDQVMVKATTTDRLGFEGRGEGMAAQAVAMLAV
jgi:2-C-methyl-D-erythritol 2,4-cyclodiphosphate synthase